MRVVAALAAAVLLLGLPPDWDEDRYGLPTEQQFDVERIAADYEYECRPALVSRDPTDMIEWMANGKKRCNSDERSVDE